MFVVIEPGCLTIDSPRGFEDNRLSQDRQSVLAGGLIGVAKVILDADAIRTAVSPKLDGKRKSELGQFFTRGTVARYMASLFKDKRLGHCRLLDAGAGIGSLTSAFLERWASGGFSFKEAGVELYEVDPLLNPFLRKTLEEYEKRLDLYTVLRNEDFVIAGAEAVGNSLYSKPCPEFTHAILNPPYGKIRSTSKHRSALRGAGIETVNLYTAFLALTVKMLVPEGQLVAIVPRSFCNGPYYRPFRELILRETAIMHLHLFHSRNKAFRDDAVLQENIIIQLERGVQQGSVTVSTSYDDSFSDLESKVVPFDSIVSPSDPDQFIHVPTSVGEGLLLASPKIRHSLEDIGVSVSTGPVVAFRAKEYLRDVPGRGSVPLLYPGHFRRQRTVWPNLELRKPNAIMRVPKTEKWLYPNGYYCVVRRFSAKEEKRRIVAGVVEPGILKNSEAIGLENHLNVFHESRQALPEKLARGLCVFLNSTEVDEYFRRFSGHTQVNATDLKRIFYPDRNALSQLGSWALKHPAASQDMIDAIVLEICA